MDANRHRIVAIILGMAVFAMPVAALAYRFGFVRALFILAWVAAVYAVARLAVNSLSRRSRAAKTVAVVLYPELLLLFFLPAHLKRSLAKLRAAEVPRAGLDEGRND